MAVSKGESHHTRNVLLVGGSLGLGAALAGILMMRSARRGVHDIEMAWGVPLEGLEDAAESVLTAVIPPLLGKQFKDFLVVAGTEAGAFDEQLTAACGLAAVAVKDRTSGVWVAGVAPEEATFGLTETRAIHRQAALYIGSPAIAEVALGVAVDGRFTGSPTQAIEISDRPTILDNYPGTPVLSRMPVITA
jgi:hypothetical protein